MAKSNGEAADIIKGSVEVLRECKSLSCRFRSRLSEVTTMRKKGASHPSANKALRETLEVAPLLQELSLLLYQKIRDLMSRFNVLSAERGSCKRSLLHKASHQIRELRKWKLSVFHVLNSLVNNSLNLVTTKHLTPEDFHETEGGGGRARSDWQFVLESIDRLNKLVTANESAFAPFSLRGEIEDLVTKTAATNDNESTPDNYLNQAVSGRWQHLHENSQPSYSQRVSKQLTSSQILRALALERSWSATTQLAKSIIVGYDQRTLENAADEVSWLTIPSNITPSASSLSGTLPSISTRSSGMASLKNKDGMGVKRKNSNKASAEASPSNSNVNGYSGEVILANDASVNHIQMIGDFLSNEEAYISQFLSVISQVPGLLSKSAIKSAKKSKINRSIRQKMAEFYHEVLWQGVGELSEPYILWNNSVPTDELTEIGGGGRREYLPFGMQHPRLSLGLCGLVEETLAAPLGDAYPSLSFPTMHLLLESLNMHVISASWDLQYMSCLAESTRPKSFTLDVTALQDSGVLKNGEKVTKTGKLFYDTIKSISRLNNRCHPDMMKDFVEHGEHDPEEFPFMEEVQAMKRLEATLFTMRNWASVRSNASLHNWHVKEFLLISQCDLHNAIDDCFKLLQLSNHETLSMNTKSISIQFFAHVQTETAKRISNCQLAIKKAPEKNLEDMAHICRTFSLATLKNVFPEAEYWKQPVPSSTTIPTASNYVHTYTDRVLAPVLEALVPMTADIQKNVARIALKTFCDAWLEFIQNRKIKFSEGGAMQIAQDFAALRQWINSNKNLKQETRRYLLLLDSIRRCEGVAKLLLSKQGEMLDVRPARNKVAPINPDGETEERAESPVHETLDTIPAELYVPDQQTWIGLKKNSKMLPFCCR